MIIQPVVCPFQVSTLLHFLSLLSRIFVLCLMLPVWIWTVSFWINYFYISMDIDLFYSSLNFSYILCLCIEALLVCHIYMVFWLQTFLSLSLDNHDNIVHTVLWHSISIFVWIADGSSLGRNRRWNSCMLTCLCYSFLILFYIHAILYGGSHAYDFFFPSLLFLCWFYSPSILFFLSLLWEDGTILLSDIISKHLFCTLWKLSPWLCWFGSTSLSLDSAEGSIFYLALLLLLSVFLQIRRDTKDKIWFLFSYYLCRIQPCVHSMH